jgi:hypothetical protein
MADVTYNTSSFPALLRTLAALLALSAKSVAKPKPELEPGPGPGPDEDDPRAAPPRDGDGDGDGDGREPLVVLAYKERDPAERQLWDMMARETGVVLECVGKLVGAGGLPVEIWLGKKKDEVLGQSRWGQLKGKGASLRGTRASPTPPV